MLQTFCEFRRASATSLTVRTRREHVEHIGSHRVNRIRRTYSDKKYPDRGFVACEELGRSNSLANENLLMNEEVCKASLGQVALLEKRPG